MILSLALIAGAFGLNFDRVGWLLLRIFTIEAPAVKAGDELLFLTRPHAAAHRGVGKLRIRG
jgi:hypothetical protein